jgi:hypothetical protein
LDIIGNGTGSGNLTRQIKLWDDVTVNSDIIINNTLKVKSDKASITNEGLIFGFTIYLGDNGTQPSTISEKGKIIARSLDIYDTDKNVIKASISSAGAIAGTSLSVGTTGTITGNTITLNGVSVPNIYSGQIGAKGLYINGTAADSSDTNSIKATGQIEALSFNVNSDIRIKKNIEYQNTNSSLETIRLLKPAKYDFIDSKKKICHGFLAQELEEILPSLITNTNNYIPNIFSNATVNGDGFKVTILNEKFSLFDLKNKENAKIEYTDASNKIFIANIKEIIDEKTFIVQEKIDFDTIFIKGEEIEDFKSIDPIQIISLNTASIIQLDKELSEAKNKINELENKIDELLKKI